MCTGHTTNSSVINSKTLHSSSTCQKQFFYKSKLEKHKKSHLHKDFKHRICSKGIFREIQAKNHGYKCLKIKTNEKFLAAFVYPNTTISNTDILEQTDEVHLLIEQVLLDIKNPDLDNISSTPNNNSKKDSSYFSG